MPRHIVHATVVHGRYDIRILTKQCTSLAMHGERVSLFVADDLGTETIDGVAVRGLGKPRFGRLGRATLGSVAMWRALRRARPDVVHVHDPELLPLGYALTVLGTPVVFDMHENLPKEILTKHWIWRPARWAISRVVQLAQRAIVRRLPTVFAERSYARDFPTAREGVTVLNFPRLSSLLGIARAKEPRFTIGYLGGISVDRGALVMADVLLSLRARGLDVGAVLVGPMAAGIEQAASFAAARTAGLLRTTGRVKPEEGWPLMAACHVGVALLDDQPNFVDSYPTKLFEYMALGLPVVVSDFPLWRAVVEPAGCGLLVDPRDTEAVADAVVWLMSHPAEASAMGARGRETVQRDYTWDSEFAKLRNLYDRVSPGTAASAVR